MDPQNPSALNNPTPVEKPKEGGFINKIYNSLASPIVSIAATPVQMLAKALGKEDPYAQGIPTGLGGENTPVSKLGLEQKVGDAAQVASYFTPTKGLLGMIGSGALQGAGQKMSEGASAEDVTKGGLLGGAISGGLGLAGKGIATLAEKLPERITRAFIPGINEETAKYATSKGLGSYEKMLKDSSLSINELGNKLGETLKDQKYAYQAAQGNDILSQVAMSLPDAGLTADDIASNLKKVVPLKAGLIDRFRKGTLTLPELQSLNSALGKNVFKTVFDDPAVKANKEIGSAAYHLISDYIKKTAPETVPLYEALSKEYPLASALEKAIRRGDKAKLVTLRDLFAIFGGGALGPMGSVTAYSLNKAIESPTVNLNTAGVLNKLAKPNVKKAGAIATPFITRGILNLGKNEEK